MSKIQRIKIENFKAISELEADFKGCTAIITGGNNKGKTSFLKALPDRIRFVRPDVMVKTGSTKGKGEMTLDSGERFIWEFNVDGQDKLTLITTEGAKRNVTVEIGTKYFPKPFDIDKFLNSTPKEQSKQLQKIIGLDFTDIDRRYAEAYQLRTDRNKDAEKFHVKLTEMMEVPKVLPVDLTKLQAQKDAERTRLNDLYKANKAANDAIRKAYEVECENVRKEVKEFNESQSDLTIRYNKTYDCIASLRSMGYEGNEVEDFLQTIKVQMFPQITTAKIPVEPTYIPEMPSDEILQGIDAEILTASQTNADAHRYREYVEYKQSVEDAKILATAADDAVKAIEAERKEMLLKATMPKGIEITSDGLTVDGLPLDRTQLSSSRITIAALQIAAINLGEVQSLFFDASYLDRNSLKEVSEWADSIGVQLLIERPDFDGGEITYTLIETA